MALPKIKVNTNWLLLGAALLLGIGAVYLSNTLIQRKLAELEAEAKRGQEMVKVVVASQDLQAGDTISSAVVAVREVPREYVHAAAVTPDNFAEMESQRLSVPLQRGEVLLPAYSEGNGGTVFSARLSKGKRALTFEVDSVNSISGMLRPGDRIDLIYTSRANETEVTMPLLSGVTVLATDQSVTKRDELTGKDRPFTTITLEVSPLDADRIIVAKSAGQLTAVLRHPDDESPNGTRMLTAANLLGNVHGAQSGPMIEYIVGGSGGGRADVQQAQMAALFGSLAKLADRAEPSKASAAKAASAASAVPAKP